ncbi:uncharacterized protein LOC123013501 isoform X2 [Tribolium madens]|uniref:uncharacterized protein LOC123013501 isoform X2 n=1 Tax=Tribolium madens TaxID=41895 RepID=UPI001CF73D30|nr:uncharacterized protein LOC123013501 isoform X2 [Tribolium madens]
MDCCYTGAEPLPALTRALQEIRLIQRRRLKTKMTSVTIGDGEATIISLHNISKTYTGTVRIVKFEDNYHVQVNSNGKNLLLIPCGQIDFLWEKCILNFHSEEQADVFKLKLPPIERPEYQNSTENSDTDFEDSGNEKTEIMKDNSFNNSSIDESEH